MSTQPKSFLTPEQYLEIERKAEFKSEYYRGEMFAMAGASLAHISIVGNLTRDLGVQVRPGPCRVYSNDMRVCTGSSGLYTYPDVVAVCGQPRLLDGATATLLNPTVIIEVLSPSNEGYDRGLKFELYQSIESLSEYVLVAQDRMRVDLFTRQSDGNWLFRSFSRAEDSVEMQSLGCRLTLADIYEKVDFAA